MSSENDLDASAATTPRQSLRIAIFVCFLNAGISTRGLEIAKALRALQNKNDDDCQDNIHIRFFSWKGPDSIVYDHLATEEDFEVSYYGPCVDERTWNQLLEYEHAGQCGDRLLPQGLRDRALANLQGALKVLDEFRPDVVVHGLLPDAPVAAQIRGIPNVFYMPIPFWKRKQLQQSRQETATDSPSASSSAEDSRRREPSYKSLHSALSKSPFLEAALACGWQPTPTSTPPHAATTANGLSSTIYRSYYYLILDLPSHYANLHDLGDASNNVQIVGPLFASPKDDDKVLPSEMKRVLTEPGKKVFLTLGSSGGKEFVIRAVQAICEGKWKAVVALAPSRCTIQDVCQVIKHIPDCVVMTQDFVPAKLIASMVDVVVAHGGQGTVQNALAAGTPIVGVAMQWEQEFNLDQAVKNGAAIRIPKELWTVTTIRQSVTEVLETDTYQRSAHRLQQEILALQKDNNSAQMKAAKLVLSIARENRSKRCQADAHSQSAGS
jgi:hypothetical protein